MSRGRISDADAAVAGGELAMRHVVQQKEIDAKLRIKALEIKERRESEQRTLAQRRAEHMEIARKEEVKLGTQRKKLELKITEHRKKCQDAAKAALDARQESLDASAGKGLVKFLWLHAVLVILVAVASVWSDIRIANKHSELACDAPVTTGFFSYLPGASQAQSTAAAFCHAQVRDSAAASAAAAADNGLRARAWGRVRSGGDCSGVWLTPPSSPSTPGRVWVRYRGIRITSNPPGGT